MIWQLLLWVSVVLAITTFTVNAEIVTEKVKLSEGHLQYYYDDSVRSPCDNVAMFAVGTAMKTEDYSELAKDIATGNSVVAIVLDNNPRGIQKQDGKKYADLVAAIAKDISNIVPTCSGTPRNGFIIGGHSGGGEGAVHALPLLKEKGVLVTGYFGMAPFELTSDMSIGVPSLMWGFSRMSCAVNPEKASEMAYEISTSNKVFYQVQTKNLNVLTDGPHCSFANAGCLTFCSGGRKYAWVHDDVSKSLIVFIGAVNSGKFDKNQFEIGRSDVILKVNE